jgi:uncharacterized RDD family membrane protein YckC
MNTHANNELRYAGFWPRLGAFLLDSLIGIPIIAILLWGSYNLRLFDLYSIIPSNLFGLFYGVYLVRRYGGTPGKLIMGIRIRKLSGEPVGYREALLRYLPSMLFGLLMEIAFIVAALHMTDSEYNTLSFVERGERLIELAPIWYTPVMIIQEVWTWSEFIVLLTNRKRRALHDFIAGTVVVYEKKDHRGTPLKL